jgi:hypothetical protein
MRRLTPILLIFVILASCNNKKTVNEKTANVEAQPGNVSNMPMDLEKIQKATQELKKLTPHTLEEMKSFLPATLMGVQGSDVSAIDGIGAAVATSKYKINDSTDLKLTIYDCAGPGGAGIYSMQWLGNFRVQEDTESQYSKTIDFKGGKAFESCKKKRARCTLTWFDERFLFELQGDNIPIEQMKDAASEVVIKK